MRAQRRDRLNRLFDEYSRSLSFVQPDMHNAFVCPICWKSFDRAAIDEELLTEEHVPPKSVTASITTMTCRKCNNDVGNRLQNQMNNYVRKKEFRHGVVPKRGIPAQAEADGVSWSCLLEGVTPEGAIKAVSFVDRLPQQMQTADAKDIVGKKVHVTLRLRSSQDVVNAAYLHAAYLILFHYLGYPYIMQPALRSIRNKITSFSTAGGIGHVVYVPQVYLNPRDRQIEVGIMGQSRDALCLAVVIAGELVVMPFSDDSYIKTFEMLDEASRTDLKEGLHRPEFHAAPITIDPNCRFSSSYRFEDGGLVDNRFKALRLVPMQ